MGGRVINHAQVYPDVEVIVADEDTQPLDKPIIDPIKIKSFTLVEKYVRPEGGSASEEKAILEACEVIADCSVLCPFRCKERTRACACVRCFAALE